MEGNIKQIIGMWEVFGLVDEESRPRPFPSVDRSQLTEEEVNGHRRAE